MKKQTHPIHSGMMLVIVIVLATVGITAFVRAKHYSPMAAHMEYIEQYHNDKCTFEQGDCPQIECFRSEPIYK